MSREAALAAEHMAIGVTALGKANYAHQAYYGQAFFALTIGMERVAKLAIVVHHALSNKGKFPNKKDIRKYKHNLCELLSRTEQIAQFLDIPNSLNRLPESSIHEAIIRILSDFANNITRYYNLDIVTGNPNVGIHGGPIEVWYKRVINPIFEKHCSAQRRMKIKQNAKTIDNIISNLTYVHHTAETGEKVNSLYDASHRSSIQEATTPYVRLYVMQIIRFLAIVITELGLEAHNKRLQDIPYLGEFFTIFRNEDTYIKRRKTWSIYRS